MPRKNGIIYKATNKINGKSYIGQTTYKLSKRIYQHYYDKDKYKDNNHFHNALSKYKKDDWNWDIVHDNILIDKLDALERKYIAKYNTFENGYNSTTGGGRHKRYSKKLLLEMEIRSTKHGKKYTKIYSAWSRMKNACYNKNVKDYMKNGALGITVDDKWRRSFESFYADVGDKTSQGMILCRIDVNKNYGPDNFIWRTRAEQCAFKRQSQDNDSGYKGVYKSHSRWMARIRIGGKKIYLGVFNTPEEASVAYDAAFVKHYGRMYK